MKIGFSIDDLPSNYITYRKKKCHGFTSQGWSTLFHKFLLICDTYNSQFYNMMLQVTPVMQVTSYLLQKLNIE